MFEQSANEWQAGMANFQQSPSSQNGHPVGEEAAEKCNTLFEGALLVDRAMRLLKCVLNGHLVEERPLTKSSMMHVFQLIELVKVRNCSIIIFNLLNFRMFLILSIQIGQQLWNGRIPHVLTTPVRCFACLKHTSNQTRNRH